MASVLVDSAAQRQAIFDLRAGGSSYRDIAAQLGLSLGKVQRELRKRAPRADGTVAEDLVGATDPAAAARGVADAGGRDGYTSAAAIQIDPVIAERQRAIQLRRLGLQESALELQSLEQQQRLDVLRRAASAGEGGGSSQVLMFLMQELQQMRAEMRAGGGIQGAATLPQRSLIDQLTDLQKLGSTIASFAPPSAPSGPADLDYKIALRKIDLEDQRLLRKDDAELKIRQSEASSVQMRNESLAKFIEQFGPTIGQLVTKWFEERQGKDQPATAAQPPQLSAAGTDQIVKGSCPQCGQVLEMSGGSAEKCPACGFLVIVAGSEIVAAAGGQNGAAPAEVPRPRVVPAPTFAS